MLKEKPLRKADIVTGGILFLIGIYVIIQSLQMPMGGTYGGVQNSWYVSPGAFPLILGSLLIVCCSLLILRAIGLGGGIDFITYCWESLKQVRSAKGYRLIGIVACLTGYVVLLRTHLLSFTYIILKKAGIGELPVVGYLASYEGSSYFFSSAIFLLVFTELFYRPENGMSGRRRHALLVGISLIFPLIIGFTFSQYLRVPLP